MSFLLSLPLNVLQEAVVGVGDQVQTARFAVLLKLCTHQLQGLLIVEGLFRVVKQHAVLWTNKLGKEVVDVGFLIEVCVCLTIGCKTTLQVSLGLVGALCQLSRQIFHFLLKNIVFSLKDHGILGKNLLRDCEAGEGISRVRYFSLDLLFLLFFTARSWLITRNRVKEDGLCIINVSRVTIQNETLVHAGRATDVGLDHLLKEIVWKAHLNGIPVEIGVLLLPCLLILFKLFILELLNLLADLLSEFVLKPFRVVNHLPDSQMRNTVRVSQEFSKVGLA